MKNTKVFLVILVVIFCQLSICFRIKKRPTNEKSSVERKAERERRLRMAGERMTLIHGDNRKEVQYRPRKYPDFLEESVTVLSTNKLPNDKKLMPTIGNGHIATVVHSDTIYANGLYNGRGANTHRARIPAACSINIVNISMDMYEPVFSLDMGRAMYIEDYSSEFLDVQLKMYAHLTVSRLMITEVTIMNAEDEDVNITISRPKVPPSEDIQFNTTTEGGFSQSDGYPYQTERNGSKRVPITVLSSPPLPEVLVVPRYTSSSYLCMSSIGYTDQVTMYSFMFGESYFLNQTLDQNHVEGWSIAMWKRGRVEAVGNDDLTRLLYSSLYYIFSSMGAVELSLPFIGISPADLAHGGNNTDYMGHIFWDQETWMFPSVLLLHANYGKKLVKTRVRTHNAAKNNAKAKGFKGAMYPFESALTGYNTCPLKVGDDLEIHITGDIANAFQLYIMATNDTDFLQKEGGADVIDDIAAFWASRVVYNTSTKLYEIRNVMGPDEYNYPVNNSVYTNVIAKKSLRLPKYISTLIKNRTVPVHYEDIAENMYIPYEQNGDWHPEFDNYKQGTKVKQADVVLLGYPLMEEVSPDVRRHDLTIYQAVTEGGPAMTWGMFAIGWLELNETDKAREMFERQFSNVVPPFNIWSENLNGTGAINFQTAMGGFLQSVLFGYGGFRIQPDELTFNAILPPDTTALNIYDVDYLGGSLDFSFTASKMNVTMTRSANHPLTLTTDSGQKYMLSLRTPLSLDRQKAAIRLQK